MLEQVVLNRFQQYDDVYVQLDHFVQRYMDKKNETECPTGCIIDEPWCILAHYQIVCS